MTDPFRNKRGGREICPLNSYHKNEDREITQQSYYLVQIEKMRCLIMKKEIEKEVETCDCCEVHENLLQIVNETLPEENELYDLAELFKVFGDSTRIRILFVLFEAEVCVCDHAKALNMTQSAISHQLRILKQNKLVKSRREGKSIFYSLADEHVRTIIDQGREHIEED